VSCWSLSALRRVICALTADPSWCVSCLRQEHPLRRILRPHQHRPNLSTEDESKRFADEGWHGRGELLSLFPYTQNLFLYSPPAGVFLQPLLQIDRLISESQARKVAAQREVSHANKILDQARWELEDQRREIFETVGGGGDVYPAHAPPGYQQRG
jgi:hypothetical protein